MRLGNIGLIISARTRSTRLPGKALLPLQGLPMILFMIQRLSGFSVGTVILATTSRDSDDQLADVVSKNGTQVYRGEENDLVARYVGAAEQFGLDTIIRATGDCPFIDADLATSCVEQAEAYETFELATTKGRFPVGLDLEIYPAQVMARLHQTDKLSADHREHLTLFLYEHRDEFNVRTLQPREEWTSNKLFTVDTMADYQLACDRVARLATSSFSIAELVTIAVDEGVRR